MYRAEPLGEPRPSDVRGLLWVPVAALDDLVGGVPPERLTQLGIEALGLSPPAGATVFVGRAGAEYLLRLLRAD